MPMKPSEARVEMMARFLCRRDAFRNNGKIGTRAEMDHHVEHLWPAFEDDARAALAAAADAMGGGHKESRRGVIRPAEVDAV